MLVGKPIAQRLQIPLYMLATARITLPGTHDEYIGTIDQLGEFTYRSDLTQGQIEEIELEFRNHIELQKIEKSRELNKLVGREGLIELEAIRDHNVLLTYDGMEDGTDLDAIMEFLKPIQVRRLIGIAPVASIEAIDRMHIMVDEIRVLSPKPNYMGTNHYFDENRLPSPEDAERMVAELHHNPAFDA